MLTLTGDCQRLPETLVIVYEELCILTFVFAHSSVSVDSHLAIAVDLDISSPNDAFYILFHDLMLTNALTCLYKYNPAREIDKFELLQMILVKMKKYSNKNSFQFIFPILVPLKPIAERITHLQLASMLLALSANLMTKKTR